jgi:hypothetical protein
MNACAYLTPCFPAVQHVAAQRVQISSCQAQVVQCAAACRGRHAFAAPEYLEQPAVPEGRESMAPKVKPTKPRVPCNGVHDSYVAAAGNLWRILALSLFGSTRIFGGLGAL